MKLEEYRSGNYKQQFEYKSFSPALINTHWTWDDPALNTLLEEAIRCLAELNAYSLIVPDMDLFTQMHVIKEANNSSRIEGTQTEMEEALLTADQIAPEKRDDWQEVQNYIQALNTAISELDRLPLSIRLLKQTHAILMSGVRGEHKTPGEFRTSQNWIGGTNLKNAAFIPPHWEEVAELMGDLEKFWHNDMVEVPHLIRIAISHYQFETIHPFLDGNGRIGRLLITLYLMDKKLLKKPSLYLSDFLERNRGAYYDALTTVRASHNLLHWVKFFLTAVTETARKGIHTFQEIMKLRVECEQKVVTLGKKAGKARLLLLSLYRNPVMQVNEVAKTLDLSIAAANNLVADFQRLGILEEVTKFKRNRIFVFKAYFNLFLN
jgi:Fic family protein